MTLIDELTVLGADTADGLQRLGGKVSFYERMLKKLPGAVEQNPVENVIASGDIQQAIANAHTLKGVCGNLSVTPMYTLYTKIVDELRKGNVDAASALVKELLPIQEQIIACIKRYM